MRSTSSWASYVKRCKIYASPLIRPRPVALALGNMAAPAERRIIQELHSEFYPRLVGAVGADLAWSPLSCHLPLEAEMTRCLLWLLAAPMPILLLWALGWLHYGPSPLP